MKKVELDEKGKRRWNTILGAMIILGIILACVWIANTIRGSDKKEVAEVEEVEEVAGEIMYVCGIDRCKDSGEYGKLIYASGINVRENTDPSRGEVIGKLNHQQLVIVQAERITAKSPGGLWYFVKGGGWINDLWLTEKPCNFGNIEKYSFKDCLMGEY